MRKIFLTLCLLINHFCIYGQCISNFSHTAISDTVNFTNLSILSNSSYYWTFGDGNSSNLENPIHIFPDDGDYLVTLYSRDSVSNCVAIYESWINVIKPDTIVCQLGFSDTIFNSSGIFYLMLLNQSTSCSCCTVDCDAGPAMNGVCNSGANHLSFHKSALFLGRAQAITYDTINGYRIYEEYYRTIPFNFDPNKNYQTCSANFEYIIDYLPTGALVSFKAMNLNATAYEWKPLGMGNQVISITATSSHLFPYITYERYFPWSVNLAIVDSINNCTDSVTHQLLIKNPFYTFPTGISTISDQTLEIYPNPVSNVLNIYCSFIKGKSFFNIYNILGEKVYTEERNLIINKKVDVSNLPKGLYSLEIISDKNRFHKLFIKE